MEAYYNFIQKNKSYFILMILHGASILATGWLLEQLLTLKDISILES